ncbi:MAG: EamA family transporter [Henriciella sp.]
MELWIPITVAAAFSQNLRSAFQKQLKAALSTWGATGARFVFAAPIAIALAIAVLLLGENGMPQTNATFFSYGALGGLAQIAATGLLIHLFSYQNFSVATAYTKTEPIQTALFGIVLLGDVLSLEIAIAILVSLFGVVLISIPKGRLGYKGWLNKRALIGIASGGLFGLSAVAYRGTSLSLEAGDTFFRASMTLAYVTILQSVIILALLRIKEPGQTAALFKNWRLAGLVGLTGMIGSLAWFIAFTMENAAHVRAVGQIEVVFMLGASIFFFKERVTAREISGVILVSLGILALILVSG